MNDNVHPDRTGAGCAWILTSALVSLLALYSFVQWVVS